MPSLTSRPTFSVAVKRERIMNRDQFKGAWKEFKGEAQRRWGQLTDDDLLQIEGDYTKFLGAIQKRYGDQKEEVKKWADKWLELHQPRKQAS